MSSVAFEIGPITCPSCGYLLTGATGMSGGGAPEAGDITVCISCGAILTFLESADGLALRLANTDEVVGLQKDNRMKLAIAQRAIFQMRRERASSN